MPSRERPWDIELNSEVYKVARDERGVPIWETKSTSEVAGEEGSIVNETRQHRSWHAGFGYSDYLLPNTYHYATGFTTDGVVAGGMDARFPRQLICGPLVTTLAPASTDGAVTGFFEDNTYIYALSGRYCNQITPSTDAISSAGGYPKDFGANYDPTPPVIFDNNVIVGFSTNASHYIYKAALTSGTASWSAQDGDVHAAYMRKVWWDTDYVLARSQYGSNNVDWVASGDEPYTAASWSADYPVGETKYPITSLTSVDSTLFVAKTDGLYYIDQSTQAPCLIEAIPVDSNNGVGTYTDSAGGIWYPCKSGLYYFDPNSGIIENRTPGNGLPNRSPIKGRVTALVQYRGWMYAAVYDGTDSYLMVGSESDGPWRWHGAIATFDATYISSLYVSALTTTPRLWMGLSNGKPAYILLPSNGDNPLLDTNCFPEETTVRAMSKIRGGSQRWYDGELVEITTAGGHNLSGTPNHPVLTDSGWKALGLLAEGDNVICCKGSEGIHNLAGEHPNNVNPAIGQLFRFLQVLGTTEHQPGTVKQFHGDGQESNIDIVLTNGLLWDRIQVALSKPLNEQEFAASHLGKSGLLGECTAMQFCDASLRASHHASNAESYRLSLLSGQPLSVDGTSSMPVSDEHPLSQQECSKAAGGHANGLRNGQAGFHIFDVPADQLLDAIRQRATPQDARLSNIPKCDSRLPEPNLQNAGVTTNGPGSGGKRFLQDSVAINQCVEVGNVVPSQSSRRTDITNSNARLDESPSQHSISDTEGSGNGVDGFSAFDVTADRVVKVERRHFAGHVYNLQTDSQWYTANGIIAHNCTFCAKAEFYIPDDDYDVAGMRWNLQGVILETENMVTNSSVAVYERCDVGTWTLLTTITTAGRTVVNTTGDKRFNRSGLKLVVTNGASTSTPIIRAVVGRAARRPAQQDVIYTTLFCSDNVLSHFGMPSRKSGKDQMDNLKTLDDYYPVTLIDYWSGTARSRTVLVMPVQERIARYVDDKGTTHAALAADVIMRVVA
jgi:hypothetical protein